MICMGHFILHWQSTCVGRVPLSVPVLPVLSHDSDGKGQPGQHSEQGGSLLQDAVPPREAVGLEHPVSLRFRARLCWDAGSVCMASVVVEMMAMMAMMIWKG